MKKMIEIQISLIIIPPKEFKLCQNLKYELRSILKGLCKYESSHEIFEGQVFDIANNEENKLLYTLKAYIEEEMLSFIKRLKKEVDDIQNTKIPFFLESLHGTIMTFELGEKKEDLSYPTKLIDIAIIDFDGENIEVLHSNTFTKTK